ncbi:hypothetical protein ZWY2020_017949 [Hordeum vulgare]|nr:hypothetical protein ZWY2020_017949 [Hordeum vulgare]
MKMPGPKGIITIAGDYKKSLECAQDSSRLGNTLVIAEEKRQIDRLVAQSIESDSFSSVPVGRRGLFQAGQRDQEDQHLILHELEEDYSPQHIPETSLL